MATVHERTRDVAPACGSSNRLAGERNMAILAAEHPASAVPRGAYLQSRAGVRRVLPPSCLTPSKAGTSPNDQLERPSPGLSPVIGPGATAFSSVASAFDFHHHVGTDPASELLVLKRILGRECVLSRLEAVCNRFRRGCRRPVVIDGDVSSTLGDGMAGVVDMLSSVRDATVTVVEAIAAWREDVLGDPPPAFMWHGENYLLKAINDLNFLAGVEPLVAALKMHPARLCRNPLMLPQTLDDQRRDSELHQTSMEGSSPRLKKRRYLYQIAQVLLDEEGLEAQREYLREGAGSSHPSAQQGVRDVASFINSDSTEFSSCQHNTNTTDDEAEEAVRRQEQLSTWYEKARLQLVSLSTSPADEEYFLSSRRFWSTEELGESRATRQTSSLLRQSLPGGRVSARQHDCIPLSRSSSDGGSKMRTIQHATKGWRIDRPELGDGVSRGKGRQQFRCDGPGVQQGMHQFGSGLDSSYRSKRSLGLHGGITGSTCSWETQVAGRSGTDEGSSALACISPEDVERLLAEKRPIAGTTVVCAAVVFLLRPDDNVPEDFCWPQGFEAVARPADEFLLRLHEVGSRAISAFKARALRFMLEREDVLPVAIESEGAHTVASLCAWVLEVLRSCEDFAQWSHAALEAWYGMQVNPRVEDVPECAEGLGPGARPLHKSLHALSDGRGSYVLTLFEERNSGGISVRAFDRGERKTFWLPISPKQLGSLGSNEKDSPANIVSALARRLALKIDSVTNTKRLVLPPLKAGDNNGGKNRASSAKRPRQPNKKKSTSCTSTSVEHDGGIDGTAPGGAVPPQPVTAVPQEFSEDITGRGGSRLPSVSGSTTGHLGPLIEGEVDSETRTAGRTAAGSGLAQDCPKLVNVEGHSLQLTRTAAGIETDAPTRIDAAEGAEEPEDGEDTQYQDEFDSEEIIHQDIGSHRPGPSGLPVPENAATLPAAARTDDSICPTATEDAGLPEEPQDGEVTAAEIDDRASNVDNYGEDDERGPAAGDSDRKCASFETRAADSVSEGNDNIGETVERSDDEKFSAAGELDCVTTDAGGGASGSQISARVAGCVGDRMSSTDGSTALVNQQRQQLDAVECPPTQVAEPTTGSVNESKKAHVAESSTVAIHSVDDSPGNNISVASPAVALDEVDGAGCNGYLDVESRAERRVAEREVSEDHLTGVFELPEGGGNPSAGIAQADSIEEEGSVDDEYGDEFGDEMQQEGDGNETPVELHHPAFVVPSNDVQNPCAGTSNIPAAVSEGTLHGRNDANQRTVGDEFGHKETAPGGRNGQPTAAESLRNAMPDDSARRPSGEVGEESGVLTCKIEEVSDEYEVEDNIEEDADCTRGKDGQRCVSTDPRAGVSRVVQEKKSAKSAVDISPSDSVANAQVTESEDYYPNDSGYVTDVSQAAGTTDHGSQGARHDTEASTPSARIPSLHEGSVAPIGELAAPTEGSSSLEEYDPSDMDMDADEFEQDFEEDTFEQDFEEDAEGPPKEMVSVEEVESSSVQFEPQREGDGGVAGEISQVASGMPTEPDEGEASVDLFEDDFEDEEFENDAAESEKGAEYAITDHVIAEDSTTRRKRSRRSSRISEDVRKNSYTSKNQEGSLPIQAADSPPLPPEVLKGNQAEDRLRDETRRGSAQQEAVAPDVAEDDFEDDFEDP